MGWILTIVGFGWAIIGLFTLRNFLSKSVGGTTPSEWGALGLTLTFLIYLGPGLLIGGLGALMVVVGRKKRSHKKEEEEEEEEEEEKEEERGVGLKKCPQCGKVVQVQAKLCRFCGYDFREPSLQTPQAKIVELRGKYIQVLREFIASKDPEEKASLRKEIDRINNEMENLRKS